MTADITYHKQELIANRMVLALLNGDDDAFLLAGEEVDQCPRCWQLIADVLAGMAAGYIEAELGQDDAAAMIENDIAELLDMAEEA